MNILSLLWSNTVIIIINISNIWNKFENAHRTNIILIAVSHYNAKMKFQQALHNINIKVSYNKCLNTFMNHSM